ncbi:MAG: hypothetical protein ACFNWU_08700 [Corynebacterium matruchotii]
MSEKSQSLAGQASQYPQDPDDASSAHSQTPSSPSAAETTQFPRVEDEEYDAAGADDSFADDSQSVERSYHTDSFERVSDSSAMTVPPSQPTQHPQQGPYFQPQYSQEPNVQQYSQGYYAPQPQQQPLAPPQSNNSVHGLLIALLVVMTILLLICVPVVLHLTGVINIPFLGSNTSNSASENQNRVVPDNQGRTTAPTKVNRPTSPALPAGAVPANASAWSNSPGGKFENAYVGSSVTSSEFASEVQKSFLIQYQLSKSTTQTLHVVSPVTGQLYEMNCTDNSQYVTCTGGINAVVYIT